MGSQRDSGLTSVWLRSGICWLLPLLLPLLGSGCASSEEDGPPVGRLQQALGVPQDGFPSWEERTLHALTNRARSDPAAEVAALCPGGGCAAYQPSAPLDYNVDLGRAARFQATSLIKARSGLTHTSVCTLVANLGSIYPGSCDGSPACACEGGSATCSCSGPAFCESPGTPLTGAAQRVALFGQYYTGENAAAGGGMDPLGALKVWIKSSGHWSNINNPNHGRLGTGFFADAGGCWPLFYLQVFSYPSKSPPALASGSHFPRTGSSSTTFNFFASYADSSGAPQLATVNIDGTCHPLTLERGTVGKNASFARSQALSSGCHRYYFFFKDSTGKVLSYPSSGSYGVGVGTATCESYSATERPPAGSDCGCSGDADCDDADPCSQDRCVAGACQSTPVPGCCMADAQCDDQDACTEDRCLAGQCQNAARPGCCATDLQCDDGNPCSTDRCLAGLCQSSPMAGCCRTAADCDDQDPCSTDRCSSQQCTHSPISGCCRQAGDCDDASDCTRDTCTANRCTYQPIPACCSQDRDCADNNPCTLESCQLPEGLCRAAPLPECCHLDTDCDDADPCTIDTCDEASAACQHEAIACKESSGADPAAPRPVLIGACQLGDTGAGSQLLLVLCLWLLLAGRRQKRPSPPRR